MDRNRDLAKILARIETKIEEQMDLDYARHGITAVDEDYTTAITGDFYGIQADGEGTTGAVLTSITIDGVTITDPPLTIPNGGVIYGNITAVTNSGSGGANLILFHKRGHGPTTSLS